MESEVSKHLPSTHNVRVGPGSWVIIQSGILVFGRVLEEDRPETLEVGVAAPEVALIGSAESLELPSRSGRLGLY
jgi:hypothetical protein